MSVGKFTFPKALLSQVNECSHGGFILLTFDDEQEPRLYSHFDSSMSALALQSYLKLCGQAFEDANLDMMSTRPLLEEEDEDEDEDFSDED
tara:strand:- start:4660 stop:4932 length:273 start_codon:yes stop_codon:yes gene_type:complete